MDPQIGDIVNAQCRVLGPGVFVPKDRMRPAKVVNRFVDQWGIDQVVVEFLPGANGEEIMIRPWGVLHAVDTIKEPEIVELIGRISA